MKNSLAFYDILNYPVPKNNDIFRLHDKIEIENSIATDSSFSREDKNILMNTFVMHVNSYSYLFKNMPFVKQVYLCNGMSFNKLDENSDIDLLVVCEPKRLLIARFYFSVIFTAMGLRWFKNKKALKFDLGFFVAQDSLDFYPQCLKPYDIYFFYWIAHLVPIYSENIQDSNIVFENNKWLSQYLTNWKPVQNVHLGVNIISGKGFVKKILEKLNIGIIGNILENLLRIIWLPIILIRSKKIGNKDDIYISEKSLRFYRNSFRKEINFKYKNYRAKSNG